MDGIAWASSAMVAARTRLEIATGNLSNVSSDGFSKAVAHGVLTRSGVTIQTQTSREHGSLRHTGQPFDLAIVGDGNFRVRDARGAITATRNGHFERDAAGALRDIHGRALLGAKGPLRVPQGANIDEHGRVLLSGRQVDRIPIARDATLRTGFIEAADVDAVGEMVTVLAAQRSFESAEKVVAAIDGTRQKAANDVARLK